MGTVYWPTVYIGRLGHYSNKSYSLIVIRLKIDLIFFIFFSNKFSFEVTHNEYFFKIKPKTIGHESSLNMVEK